jgi:hypothetical protein
LNGKSRTALEPWLMSRSAIGFTVLLAPPLLPVEAVVLKLKECHTDHEAPVQFWVAIPKEGNSFESDVSASWTPISRAQSKEVLRWLLEDCASQRALVPSVEALAKKRPGVRGTAEPVGDFRSRNSIHILSLHRPQWILVLALISVPQCIHISSRESVAPDLSATAEDVSLSAATPNVSATPGTNTREPLRPKRWLDGAY